MNTEDKLIYSSGELHEKRQSFDFLDDSLIAYRKKIKSKVKKPLMNSFSLDTNKNQEINSRYGYKPVNDFSKISGSNRFLYQNAPDLLTDPDLLIKEYFLAQPSNRKNLRKCIAKRIDTVAAVLEILEWSTKSHVQEPYDGAIDILAECSDVILKVANQKLINFTTTDIYAQGEKWEVLIKGIACSQNISASRKFNVITNLISETNNSRFVKAAIIDALIIIQDEIDGDSIKSYLTRFLANKQQDKQIQKYASEAIEQII